MTDARIDQVKGDIKEGAGKVTGDRDLEAEGAAESALAGLRRDAGEVADKARDMAGDVADKAGDLAGKARDAAGDVADKAGEMAGDASRKVQDAFKR
ncbi:MAG: CsbD family protein [Chloroflexi bacterium]|nr:CsbD family protein [Chloroflexota bacterium]